VQSTAAPPAPSPSASSRHPPAASHDQAHPPTSSAAKPATAKTLPAPPAAKTPVPDKPRSATLDLMALEQRLRDTHAIGVFTKLSLKNQVDDLLSAFRAFHRSSEKSPPDDLRRAYDGLMLKVLSLLQNGDPQLAAAIASSREAIWGVLIDPQKFSTI
jgi:hypothetical protein